MTIRVNGEEIPEAAVQFELNRPVKFYAKHISPEQIREQMGLLKKKAKEQAIGAKLLIAEALRLNLRAPPASVDARFNKMVDDAGGSEAFNELLGKQNLTEDILRESIGRGRQVDMLIEKITEGISDPTEAEMAEHFRKHAREYVKPDRAQAQHILIKAGSDSEEDKKHARSRLLEIRKRIEEGASFADQAAAYSDCPSGRKTGGSLGWFSQGMMVPEFDRAVFSMEVGQLSEVIETSLGYHIILKTAHEDGGEATFDEVRDKIHEFLRHTRRGQAISEYVNDLKKKAVIEKC